MFLILFAILAVTLFYWKIVKPYSHWTERGVRHKKPIYLFGDIGGVIFRKESLWDVVLDLYRAFPDERYVGMYYMLTPTLMVKDLDLIKQIMVRDFDHFVDHRQWSPEGHDELWDRNLFSLKGSRWRDMRTTMSPSFTAHKMKTIFNLVSECAVELNKYFLETANDITSVELKDSFTRYTNDVIATVAFGIKCDSLREPKNEFYLMGKEATSFTGLWKSLKFFSFLMSPTLCKLSGMSLFSKDVTAFFIRIVKETIQIRQQNGINRPDLLQLLMDAKNGRLQKEESDDLIDTGFAIAKESIVNKNDKVMKQDITDIDITAQGLVFFFAGFETTSTLMCFLGQELVENPQVQEKLQKEVDDTMIECKGRLTYEALLKMKYMDMVVSEALRKWPPATTTDRVCTKPYTIQPTKASEKPVHLNKGDAVRIPICSLHRDPQYFPQPDVFLPERFSDENKGNIKPYTYLPFGVGPRNCIGAKFALMETKTLYFHLLSKFDLVPVDKTQIPFELSKKTSFQLSAEKGFWLGLKRRSSI